MPRRGVEFLKGGYYHIYNRGVNHQPIFQEPDNYLHVLRLLRHYLGECTVAPVAYCLMPNHYHLLLRQDGETPAGKVPQLTFNAYAKAYNKRYNRQGALFQGRYHAVHVDSDEYLAVLCCYIHANPVKAAIVQRPEDWPYSNYPEWIGARKGKLVDQGLVADIYPDRAEYRRYVNDYIAAIKNLPEETGPYLLDS